MCGIVGYCGKRAAAPFLLDGLQKLEYRGYDSAGIALLNGGKFAVVKKKGRVRELEEARALSGNIGIGHTRWATHGAPSERNAHPHVYGKFAVVHNGIIENEFAIRSECMARGERFSSETDSESIAHLLDHCYHGDLLAAVRETADKLKGSFAIAVLCTDYPNTIVCARKASPLVVGRGSDGVFVASDIPAIAAGDAEVYPLGDGEFALLNEGEIGFYDCNAVKIAKEAAAYDAETDIPDKKGFRHFMRKEMAEIPAVLERSDTDFAAEGSAFYGVLQRTECVHIVACGTAYHSGLCAKHAIEALCRVPVEVTIASEYRYRDPIVGRNTLALAVSQSGETADTLAAAQIAKERGAYLAAVTNVPYSSLTRLADCVLPTNAGREIAVAATKSFNAQLMLLYSLAVALAKAKGRRAENRLKELPRLAERAVQTCEEVRAWTPHFLGAKSVFFLGRGADHCAALEGSLKLKEITYLPSEGYPAGELKHGTLALVDGSTPVVAVLTQRALAEKTMNAVSEVYARGAKVFLVTSLPEYRLRKEVTASVLIPPCDEPFTPILSVIPLQALAYYVSIARGNDPDKPRNLAKSVTVE